METRDKLMSLTQSDKTQQWLMDKSSNQDDIQQLQQQFSQQLDQQYNALLADEKAKLDQIRGSTSRIGIIKGRD